MSRHLVLCLDAPMMSFGGVSVDQLGFTEEHPTLSMLTGLLANALGYEHREHDRISRLQERIRYGARRDVHSRSQWGIADETLVDYQTVDLGQPHLTPGWTTRGRVDERDGAFSEGTHIRKRHYLVDQRFTVLIGLEPADEDPTLSALANALLHPERPLFFGRKSCLPSERILVDIIDVESIEVGLRTANSPHLPATAWVDAGDTSDGDAISISDRRDWMNQAHTGRRRIRRLMLERSDVR